MGYQKIKVPADGDKITVNADLSLNVPNFPIIPFIEGDGIGFDITPVMIKVVNAAVSKSYGSKRDIIDVTAREPLAIPAPVEHVDYAAEIARLANRERVPVGGHEECGAVSGGHGCRSGGVARACRLR